MVNLREQENKYNSPIHTSTKKKPVDIKPYTYIDFPVDSKIKRHKAKVCNHVRISKYKHIFPKRCKATLATLAKEVFVTE